MSSHTANGRVKSFTRFRIFSRQGFRVGLHSDEDHMTLP